MDVTTEYKIGQKIYYVRVNGDYNSIEIRRDTIKSILIEKDKTIYYTKNCFDGIEQDYIVGLSEKEKLYKIIEQLKERAIRNESI